MLPYINDKCLLINLSKHSLNCKTVLSDMAISKHGKFTC